MGDSLIENYAVQAEHFNSHFCSVGSELDSKLPHSIWLPLSYMWQSGITLFYAGPASDIGIELIIGGIIVDLAFQILFRLLLRTSFIVYYRTSFITRNPDSNNTKLCIQNINHNGTVNKDTLRHLCNLSANSSAVISWYEDNFHDKIKDRTLSDGQVQYQRDSGLIWPNMAANSHLTQIRNILHN